MPRLLLVGWDAADWKLIDPLLAKGEMPHLASIIRDGVRGNLATIAPPLSPMVWTSIATGKRPYKHGIHGFTEPTDDGHAVRPVTNLGRQCKAFWNILHQNGKRSLVVGWWPSHPAEPIRGAMVSNFFPPSRHEDPGTPVPAGAVWPPALASRLADLRVHGAELTGDMLRFFVPDAPAVDQSKDRSLADLAHIVAECMSVHGAATELMETEPWDLAATYFCGIDHFCHRFMEYHARKVRSGSKTDPAILAGVVANAYRYHDLMLGRLLQLAGPDCGVMVLSDHGFHSDHLMPDYLPAEAAGPAHDHRDFGIFAFRAPGVRAGQRVYGASVLDIAPTVLHYFGLPAARDMDGKPLVNAFHAAAAPEPIDSWETVIAEDGRHPPSRRYDGIATAESLRQLVDLGYIAPPAENARRTVEQCVAESRYNLARAWMGGGFPAPAARILEELLAADSEDARFYERLFECRLAVADRQGAAAILESFDRAAAEFAPKAKAELERRRADGPADEDAGRREIYERRKLGEKTSGYLSTRLMLRVRLALAEATTPKRRAGARPFVEDLAARIGDTAALSYFLAEAFVAVGDPARALSYLARARRADHDHWRALALEARIHLSARRYQEAAACAIDSLALVYVQPHTHVTLGAALIRLGDLERAEHAFRVAIAQAPGLIEAHRRLGALLRRNPARLAESAVALAQAELLRKKVARKRSRAAAQMDSPPEDTPALTFERWSGPPADRARTLVIVSGLPRSGTSMMMQMLAAGGLRPFTDDLRQPDDDNPRGYFEHEQATRLHRDASWLPDARGKAVKIVAPLLPHLPSGEEYRVVLMLRNLDEVIASQRQMLARLKRKGAALGDRALRRAYAGHLVALQQWLQARSEIAVLPVDYARALADPAATASRLAAFLGVPFDAEAAAAAVAPSLRRQKVG